MEVKKSKRAAIENQRGTWLLMGFVVVLAFMFVTFEWTQHDIKVATGSLADEPVFVETLLPITYPEEKLEPPPPPVVKVAELLNIVDDDDLEADAVVLGFDDFEDPVEIKYRPVVVETENEPVEDEILVTAERCRNFRVEMGLCYSTLTRILSILLSPRNRGSKGG